MDVGQESGLKRASGMSCAAVGCAESGSPATTSRPPRTLTPCFPRAEEPQEQRTLKRKKTVTWADGEELVLAVDTEDGAGGPGALEEQPLDAQAIVVLPADSLYSGLDAGLLDAQGGWAPGEVGTR